VDVDEVGTLVEVLGRQLGDLTALVGGLSDDGFRLPTRCVGWTVAELVAHCEGILLRLVGEDAVGVEAGAEIDLSATTASTPTAPARERTRIRASPRSGETG
jgi:hypothetical protein